MVDVMMRFSEQTVADTAIAAVAQGMSFNDYVEWRLNVELDAKVEGRLDEELEENKSEVPIEEVAQELFKVALMQSVDEEESEVYLVEDLYKRLNRYSPWTLHKRGYRIGLGKAFKRLIQAQHKGGYEIDGWCMRVEPAGFTNQNQAKYRTKRVG